jgi:hypothetical protein
MVGWSSERDCAIVWWLLERGEGKREEGGRGFELTGREGEKREKREEK